MCGSNLLYVVQMLSLWNYWLCTRSVRRQRQLLGMIGWNDFSRGFNTTRNPLSWVSDWNWLGWKEAGSRCLFSPKWRVSSTLCFWYLANVFSGLCLVWVETHCFGALEPWLDFQPSLSSFFACHSFKEHTRS